MKKPHHIIFSRDYPELPGYIETPHGDGVYYHDPKRAKQSQVNELIRLMDESDITNDNFDKVLNRCDFYAESIEDDGRGEGT